MSLQQFQLLIVLGKVLSSISLFFVIVRIIAIPLSARVRALVGKYPGWHIFWGIASVLVLQISFSPIRPSAAMIQQTLEERLLNHGGWIELQKECLLMASNYPTVNLAHLRYDWNTCTGQLISIFPESSPAKVNIPSPPALTALAPFHPHIKISHQSNSPPSNLISIRFLSEISGFTLVIPITPELPKNEAANSTTLPNFPNLKLVAPGVYAAY